MTAPEFSVASVTDIGCKRKNNEDSLLSFPECGLFCVADGMGGAREGQVASKALTDALQQEFKSTGAKHLDLAAKTKLIREVVNQVNAWIKKRAEDRGYAQMGSTLVVGLFDEKNPLRGIAIHAGDSRLYRYRNRALKQFTVDHTVAELAARSEKDLPVQFRGVLTKVIGLCETIELDETPFDVEPDDLYLLCSDGLTRMLPDQSIQKLLEQNETQDIGARAQGLVEEAKKAGGDDNISVILIKTHFDRQNVDVIKKAGELSQGEQGPETATLASSKLDQDQDGANPTTKIKEIPENDTAEGDTPTTDNSRHDGKSDLGEKEDGIPVSWGSQSKDGGNTPSKSKLIGGISIVALILAAWLMASHQNQYGDSEKSVRVMVTSPPSSFATGGIARALSAPSATETTLVAVSTTSSLVIASVGPDKTTAATVYQALRIPTDEIVAATSSPVTAVPEPPVVSTSGVAVAMTRQEPPQFVDQVPKPEPVGPPVEHPPTNIVSPPAPVVVAQKSNAEKEWESMEKARKALVDGLDNAFKTGQWGALKKALGPWADKLELLEADDARRAILLAWMKLWDDASKDSSLADTSGDARERADDYCRSYFEQQTALLKRIAAYADEEERRMAALGDRIGQYVTNLWSFMEGTSMTSDCGNICKNFEESKKGIAAFKSWTQARRSFDAPLQLDDYPLKDIKTVQEQGDVAWDQLYLLIEPLDQQMVFKRIRVEEATDLQLDKIATLHKEIVVERRECAGVRPWRLAADVERIRDLLAEVSNVALSLRQDANASQ